MNSQGEKSEKEELELLRDAVYNRENYGMRELDRLQELEAKFE